jgi:outer membrane protein TolC
MSRNSARPDLRTSSRRRFGWGHLVVLVIGFLVASPLLARTAVPSTTLGIEEAVRAALARDQSLSRLTAEADALAERAIADGQLPDPELAVGYQNLPLDGFPTTDDMMTMLMVGVRQHFPAGRTRHLQRDLGELTASARRIEHDDRRLEIAREVRGAWLDWRYAYQAQALAADAQTRFEELVALTLRQVAAGTALQRDLSRARLELIALRERVIGFAADRDVAAAELARWLDVALTDAHVPGGAPDWPAPDVDAVRSGLARHPALQRLDTLVEAGQTESDIARQAYRPSWMVELGYGYRRGTDMATGDDRSDMLAGMVAVNVPLFTAQRQDRRLAAAQHDADAARYARADLLRRLDGDLAREATSWRRFDELVRLLEDDLLPEAEQTVLSTQSAYRSDRATFEELIRASVDELDYRLRALALARQRDQARVALLYLSGD